MGISSGTLLWLVLMVVTTTFFAFLYVQIRPGKQKHLSEKRAGDDDTLPPKESTMAEERDDSDEVR